MTGATPFSADALRPRLADALDALGLGLDTGQVDLLLSYLALIDKWNRVYNLTSVRDPANMLVQHLIDSLAAVGPLRRQLGQGGHSLLDVGSGAGLPGVVFAICQPELAVSCIDTVGKKASFIRQVGMTLGLQNLRAIHGRIEEVKESFDIVSCRAFASLRDFVDGSRATLKDGGVWMALKGKRPDDEMTALPDDVSVFHVEPLRVPQLEAERCIVWMRVRAA